MAKIIIDKSLPDIIKYRDWNSDWYFERDGRRVYTNWRHIYFNYAYDNPYMLLATLISNINKGLLKSWDDATLRIDGVHRGNTVPYMQCHHAPGHKGRPRSYTVPMIQARKNQAYFLRHFSKRDWRQKPGWHLELAIGEGYDKIIQLVDAGWPDSCVVVNMLTKDAKGPNKERIRDYLEPLVRNPDLDRLVAELNKPLCTEGKSLGNS